MSEEEIAVNYSALGIKLRDSLREKKVTELRQSETFLTEVECDQLIDAGLVKVTGWETTPEGESDPVISLKEDFSRSLPG